MKWLTNFKIGPRLAAGFGITLLLVAAMGTLSVTQSSRIYGGTQDITTNWLPSIQALGELRNSVAGARSASLRYILADAGESRKTWETAYLNRIAQFSKDRQVYETMISSPEERSLVNEFDAAWRDFTAANGQILKQGDSGADIHALRALVVGDASDAYNRVSATIDKDVALNRTGANAAGAAAAAAYRMSLIVTVALAALALVTGMVVAFIIARSIVTPIKRAVTIAETVADGDLTSRIDISGRDETSDLLRALQGMSEKLAALVGSVRHSSESIATGSAEIAAGNTDLSQRTEEQAAALEQTAASMEELTATVKQNADNAKQGNTLAQDASAVASKGGAVVERVIGTMQEIQSSSVKVSDIISVIEGIAFQTNILALNAAVEAARAGEQGRGFAVVAGEVRTLAQRSAAAAKEIKELIDHSVSAVAEGSALVNEAGVTMQEVVRSVAKVTDLMGEISAASTEQHTGIEQVNQAVMQMDEVTQQNAALVEEASAAAQSMAAQSTSLKEMMTAFRLTPADAARAPATTARSGGSNVHGASRAARQVATAAKKTGSIAGTAAGTATARRVETPVAVAKPAPVLKRPVVARQPVAGTGAAASTFSRASSKAVTTADDSWESF